MKLPTPVVLITVSIERVFICRKNDNSCLDIQSAEVIDKCDFCTTADIRTVSIHPALHLDTCLKINAKLIEMF